MLIEWQDKYSVGVPRIDEQHRQLIDLLNQLYKKVGASAASQEIWPLLVNFNRYADNHFETEERIAREASIAMPNQVGHNRLHENYRDRMKAFRASLERDDKRVAVQLLAFLNNWWLQHILVEDRELGQLICDALAHKRHA